MSAQTLTLKGLEVSQAFTEHCTPLIQLVPWSGDFREIKKAATVKFRA